MGVFEDFQIKNLDKITELSELARTSTIIDASYYEKYDVKRGLRDINGNGVLAGLTEISEIQAFNKLADGTQEPCEGKLFYRGYSIEDIVDGFVGEGRFGFEETAYLLLFGKLPTQEDLKAFREILMGLTPLPTSFVRDIIMKAPSTDMMNTLARSVLALYSYDDKADDISMPNVLRQCLQLIAQFSSIAVYGYKVYSHYHDNASLVIHNPSPSLSIAENILHMLRDNSLYTTLEAKVLDMALVLHAEHGGGNNSSFTTHVVSSSGTDTYSVIAAALGSLKGPRHGGANIKVVKMFEDMNNTLTCDSDAEVEDYIARLLDKNAFDKAGLVYGMGHAIYSLSDPRAIMLQKYAKDLAIEKGKEKEFALYEKVERLAPQVIADKRKIYKGVSANVDFFSGFIYSLLQLPVEMFTPIFAVSRIVGWSAHRIEELANNGKIIRPGYKSIAQRKDYVAIADRTND
ncbi:MAG: citrate/2-methylcitrate synthase [Clostridia bacterium]